MTKIILFNGPPGSGKDTAAEGAAPHFNAEIMRFKDKLFALTAEVFSVPLEDLTGRMYTREAKEMPHIELKGMSPREALITVSEDMIKPVLGEHYFGDALSKNIKALEDDSVVMVSDSGFIDETLALLERFPAEDIFVIRIFREGCTFENDSRDYLDDDELFSYGMHCVDVHNDGTISEMVLDVVDLVEQFIEEE